MENTNKYSCYLELDNKPDANECMKRVQAWYEGEIIDRAPVQFHRHNMTERKDSTTGKWASIKERWFDSHYQIEHYLNTIKGRSFLGETFPVYWPNLGPDVLAAFYGIDLEFMDETSWANHLHNEIDELPGILKLDFQNTYFKKIEELTADALQQAKGKFLVGYSDFHPGFDSVAAWRDPQQLCMDLLLSRDMVKVLLNEVAIGFQKVYDYYDLLLKKHNQPSCNWMELPFCGRLHIPSSDFAAMISNDDFIDLYLPLLKEEIKPMTHNIFHLDGAGVANHLDIILEIDDIKAIQWVQGQGDNKPIMQWETLINKVVAAKRSIIVMIEPNELDRFINEFSPDRILLCIPSTNEEQELAIIKKIEKWK